MSEPDFMPCPFDWKAAIENARLLESDLSKKLKEEFGRLLATGKPFIVTNGDEVIMRVPGVVNE